MSESEPEILSCGRRHVNDFSPEEFKAALTRAFNNPQTDFVVLGSNRNNQRFLAACTAWAVDCGWLYLHNDKNSDEGQCKIYSFRLTEAGRKAILG